MGGWHCQEREECIDVFMGELSMSTECNAIKDCSPIGGGVGKLITCPEQAKVLALKFILGNTVHPAINNENSGEALILMFLHSHNVALGLGKNER